jgi:hypothetical protein
MDTRTPNPIVASKKEDLRELAIPFLNSSQNDFLPIIPKWGRYIVYIPIANPGEL